MKLQKQLKLHSKNRIVAELSEERKFLNSYQKPQKKWQEHVLRQFVMKKSTEREQNKRKTNENHADVCYSIS